MVAPSLLMVAFPCKHRCVIRLFYNQNIEVAVRTLGSTMSLSMPLGPRVVLTASTMAWQALMLEMTCCFPPALSVPSFSNKI